MVNVWKIYSRPFCFWVQLLFGSGLLCLSLRAVTCSVHDDWPAKKTSNLSEFLSFSYHSIRVIELVFRQLFQFSFARFCEIPFLPGIRLCFFPWLSDLSFFTFIAYFSFCLVLTPLSRPYKCLPTKYNSHLTFCFLRVPPSPPDPKFARTCRFCFPWIPSSKTEVKGSTLISVGQIDVQICKI